jgi:hypothetical protein
MSAAFRKAEGKKELNSLTMTSTAHDLRFTVNGTRQGLQSAISLCEHHSLHIKPIRIKSPGLT